MATILIVDDASANRQYLLTLLGYFGHCLLEASDGEEALAIAASQRPDLIISDMVMPRMDGEELTIRLRKRIELASIPVVFYTATCSAAQALVIAGQVGAFGVLRKPSDPEVILSLVNRALGLPPAVQASQTLSILEKLPEERPALEALTCRLASLIEMGLELTAERDPERLLGTLAYLARKLVPSKYAAVLLFPEGGKPAQFYSSTGLEAERGRLPWPADAAALAALVERGTGPDGAPALSVPFEAPARHLGRLCLLEKLGADGFSAEDRRVATILASQAAAAYRNAGDPQRATEFSPELEKRTAELSVAP